MAGADAEQVLGGSALQPDEEPAPEGGGAGDDRSAFARHHRAAGEIWLFGRGVVRVAQGVAFLLGPRHRRLHCQADQYAVSVWI